MDKAMKEYDTSTNYQRYNYRLNLDMNVTASTLIQVGIGGALEKTNRSAQLTPMISGTIFGYNRLRYQ